MAAMPTLRHAGILVKDIEQAREAYELLGFLPCAPVEHLKVLKLQDELGQTIELVQGNWHPHIAVNWYEDQDGNYIECVSDIRYPEEIRADDIERRLRIENYRRNRD